MHNNTRINIEISLDKLEALFNDGKLCAADVRCLDENSKQHIWHICITACRKHMQCTQPQKQNLSITQTIAISHAS